MTKYLVEVVMSACVAIEVEAHDEEEARSLALEEADPFTVDDWDYDVNCVYGDDNDEDEEEEE